MGFSLYMLIYPVIAAFTGWLGMWLKNFLQAHTKNATVSGILGRFTDSVFSAVKKVEGTLKDKILAAKDPKSDGGAVITEAEAASLRAAVWDELKAEYGGLEGVKAFLDVLGLGDVESWVNTRIEAAVHDVGVAQTAAEAGNAPLP